MILTNKQNQIQNPIILNQLMSQKNLLKLLRIKNQTVVIEEDVRFMMTIHHHFVLHATHVSNQNQKNVLQNKRIKENIKIDVYRIIRHAMIRKIFIIKVVNSELKKYLQLFSVRKNVIL